MELPDKVTSDEVARDLVICILAGGAGTRFWPASTRRRPKQFLRFFGERSLLQQSFDRAVDLAGAERVLVLTGSDFTDLCRQQLPELPPENVIGEPMRRDTAAAVALGATVVHARFGDRVVAVVTADHLIEPVAEFQRTLLSAAKEAAAGEALYTFGIPPDHPSTGFGYLELGAQIADNEGILHHRLVRFVEKPDRDTAKRYIESGRFLWNSGMFLWRVSTLLREFERQLPAHLERIGKAVENDGQEDFESRLVEAFEPLTRVSVDYGIMENAPAVRTVRAAFSWYDVGSFDALADHLPRDDCDNAHRGRVTPLDARGNVVFSEDPGEHIALVGVEDLIVVRSGSRTLVIPRSRSQDIKRLVAMLPSEIR